MRPNLEYWMFISEFINSKKIGEIITRKEMLEKFRQTYSRDCQTKTLDGYRNLLTRIGILEWYKLGKYIKLQDIPKKLTSTKARKLLYDRSWKDWFAENMEDRLKML